MILCYHSELTERCLKLRLYQKAYPRSPMVIKATFQWRIQGNTPPPPLPPFDRLRVFLFTFCIIILQNKAQINRTSSRDLNRTLVAREFAFCARDVRYAHIIFGTPHLKILDPPLHSEATATIKTPRCGIST